MYFGRLSQLLEDEEEGTIYGPYTYRVEVNEPAPAPGFTVPQPEPGTMGPPAPGSEFTVPQPSPSTMGPPAPSKFPWLLVAVVLGLFLLKKRKR